MEIQLRLGKATEEKADALFIPVFEGDEEKHASVKLIDKAFDGEIVKELGRTGYKAKPGSDLSLPMLGRMKFSCAVFSGLGSKKKYETDAARKFGGGAYKTAKAMKAGSVAIQFEDIQHGGLPSKELFAALAEGLLLAGYSFSHFQSKKKQRDVKRAVIYTEDKRTLAALERTLEEVTRVVEGVCLARELVNMPPSEMHPEAMLRAAEALAAENKQIKIKVLDKERMERLGMRAALAVANGSDYPPFGVHLTYTPSKKAKKRVILVGKAVTFDSGGLSLKPADGMKTMKIDMGGAATVLGLFKALPAIDPSVEVHGIFLAVENMPSGRAYRPGDIVRAMNGKTIEILNTDAEGRVTLADALSYASKLSPDIVIDLATLTGACVSALGEEIAGLMTRDDRLADKLLAASHEAGEPLWRLPLFEEYKQDIKSKVADVRNLGGRGAGAITAGLFLEHFVEAPSWAHLDVAGPVYTEKETRPDLPYGATGYGVRLLARYLQAL